MTLNDVANIRSFNQQVAFSRFTSARELVRWMGAMQAQDFRMAKWAIGLRTTGSTEQLINKAIDSGEIIRTHLLRPTWHLVPSEDVYWMLELTAPQIRTILRTRHNQLGFNDPIIEKCYGVIKEALKGRHYLSREELAGHLNKIGITNENNRLAHVLLLAEISGLICSGTTQGDQQTYALLEERVKKPEGISKEKALEKLALRYFLSRGPATLLDFKWWSGLTIKDARNALESVKSSLEQAVIGPDIYWMSKDVSSFNGQSSSSLFLLPAYDEFLISYNDRSASLPDIQNKKTISDNGIFRPLIVSDGQVIGIWKRTTKKEIKLIECELFQTANKAIKKNIETVAEKFSLFLNKKVEVVFKR